MSARFNTQASQLNEAITRTVCIHAQAMVAFDFYDRQGDKKRKILCRHLAILKNGRCLHRRRIPSFGVLKTYANLNLRLVGFEDDLTNR